MGGGCEGSRDRERGLKGGVGSSSRRQELGEFQVFGFQGIISTRVRSRFEVLDGARRDPTVPLDFGPFRSSRRVRLDILAGSDARNTRGGSICKKKKCPPLVSSGDDHTVGMDVFKESRVPHCGWRLRPAKQLLTERS